MKKILSFFTALTIMCTFSVSAYAADWISDENTLIGGADAPTAIYVANDGISVILNGSPLVFTDCFPEEINDRVMLPFRTVLEGMDAEVEYDGQSETVTAALGDTTVSFTIGEDTIYVDKSGEKSEIKSDVPIIEKDGRTLVPVRFIGNALGMYVGWDDFYNTVYIVDLDAYAAEIAEKAPNLAKLAEFGTPDFNTYETTLALNTVGEDGITLKLDVSSQKTEEGVIGISGTVSADLTALNESIPKTEDTEFEIVIDGGIAYFKTELLRELVAANSDISAFVALLPDDGWLCANTEEICDLISNLFADDDIFGGFLQTALNASFYTGENNTTIWDMLETLVSLSGDAVYTVIDTLPDMYGTMDKYISVTDDSVEIKMDGSALLEIIFTMLGADAADLGSDVSAAELFGGIIFDLDINESIGENELSSAASLTFGSSEDTSDETGISLEVAQTGKNGEELISVKIPESSVDIIKLMSSVDNY